MSLFITLSLQKMNQMVLVAAVDLLYTFLDRLLLMVCSYALGPAYNEFG